VKIIKACLKLYNDKDHHTNGDTNSQPGDVDNSIIPVTDQTPGCGFKIIFKHGRSFMFYVLRIFMLQTFVLSSSSVVSLTSAFRTLLINCRDLDLILTQTRLLLHSLP